MLFSLLNVTCYFLKCDVHLLCNATGVQSYMQLPKHCCGMYARGVFICLQTFIFYNVLTLLHSMLWCDWCDFVAESVSLPVKSESVYCDILFKVTYRPVSGNRRWFVSMCCWMMPSVITSARRYCNPSCMFVGSFDHSLTLGPVLIKIL